MNNLKVVIILLTLLHFIISSHSPGGGGAAAVVVVASCPVVLQNGTVTCSINCNICNNGTCLSCCSGYYLLSNTCNPCYDSNCLSCSDTQCYQCNTGYSRMVSYLNNCSATSVSTTYNCQSVNLCYVNSTCIYYHVYALNNGSQCVQCSLIFRFCTYCNNSRCLQCQAGYYLNSTADYKQCVICSVPMCSSCIYADVCGTCNSGYYVRNNYCELCILPCLTCISATNCSSCDTSLQLYVLVNNTCVACNSSMVGCLACALIVNSTNVTCSTCLDGYYLSGTGCFSCLDPCFKCSATPSRCLSCVNSTYVYDAANFLCQNCPTLFPNCTNCTLSACLKCSTGFYLSGISCVNCNLTYPGCDTCNNVKCFTCLSGYTLIPNLTCISSTCNLPCSMCGFTASTCLQCIVGYYLSASTCLPCIFPCKTCTSSTFCLTCYEQTQYNSGTCIPCINGLRYNPFSLRCQLCPRNCLTCHWWNGCYNCTSPLFSVINKVCSDICGDTYAIQLQCDNVLGVANDGCTDSCTIQPNYNCTKMLSTATINGVATSVNISKCSYIGSTSVSIVSAVQSLFTNNLKIGFSIKPYLSGMPTSADTQSYLKSIFTLSPLDIQASYGISVDQKLGIVYFSIDHTSDISGIGPTLSINYNYLASINTMFQYMSNASFPFSQINQILSSGRLGEAEQDANLQLAKTVYNLSSAIAICSLFIMIFGIFGKQLVGLDQVILCQHVFFLLVFYKGKLTLPLLSLSGLKYSTGIHFQDSLISINQNQSYILQFDSSSFLYNFNFNLAAYALPLIISFFILLYKLRYKHLPAWRDLAQQLYEVIMGQTILYITMFNFSGLIAYSYLFYTSSSKSRHYYDSVAISLATLMTLFALFNFFVKPQIVGMFRSAFKTDSDERDNRRSKLMEKFSNCISKRCCENNLKPFYNKIAINFYFIYICYLILFVGVIAFSPLYPIILILGIQLLIFTIIILARPHFNPFQKLRALFTWTIVIIGTLMVVVSPKTFMLPVLFLILLAIHIIGSILIIIQSIWQQIKRKCNDRTEVIKKLMKEGQVQGEKKALRELILRYQNFDRNKTSMAHQVQKIQLSFKQNFAKQYEQIQIETPKQQIDEDKIQFQQQIIKEQHQHFRYQKGLQFFNRYANNIDLDLIKEYPGIEEQN